MKYINAEKLKILIQQLIGECIRNNWSTTEYCLRKILSVIDSLQQEQPEPYFYCKYSDTMPLCSDCKRNHNNSPFKTEEITTWYAPSNGTKRCIDYIQQEQPEVDLEKEIELIKGDYEQVDVAWNNDFDNIARHFYELGLKTKGE